MSEATPEFDEVQRLSTLLLAKRGPVGWLIFNRPEVGNAMNATMLRELEEAWRTLDADPKVRVIVNTGEGGTFQSGLDVAELAHDREALREQSRRTRDAELRLTAWHNRVGKPVIAAINGTCAGGGLHFVADADVVLASSDASFLDPHVSLGQVSAFEVIALARKIPAEAVFRMALLGSHERLTVARAHQLGLVSEIVDPPGDLRRGRTRAGRDDRPELPGSDGGDEACDVADLRARSDRRLQGGRRRHRVGVGPSRPGRGPSGVLRAP